MIEKFRNNVEFFEITGVSDGMGGITGNTQTSKGTAWARVERMKGNEALTMEQLLNAIPYKMTIRSFDLPSAFDIGTYRVNVDSTLFSIHSKAVDEYSRFTTLICWSSAEQIS